MILWQIIVAKASDKVPVVVIIVIIIVVAVAAVDVAIITYADSVGWRG